MLSEPVPSAHCRYLQVSLWFNMHNRQSDHPLSAYANVEGWVRRTAELGFTGESQEKVSHHETHHPDGR